MICVSHLSKTLYERFGFNPERITVIVNGVTVGVGDGVRVRNEGLNVGTVARLSPEKAIDVLIHAIANMPEISLSIIGKGPEESEIKRLIREDTERLGIGIPRIQLESHVDNLENFYRSLDVFVLPSTDHDPFGLVAAEAMMCGIPVITTYQCGISDYLKNGEDALIVKAGSGEKLQNALEQLKDETVRKRIGEAGQKTALERFSLMRMVDEYKKILQK